MPLPWASNSDPFLDSFKTVRQLQEYFDTRYAAPSFGTDAAFVAAGVRDRIYLRPRTDDPPEVTTNVRGSGTSLDPFDVSSAERLAAVWAYLASKTFTARVFLAGTVMLPAGTALGNGAYPSLLLPDGCSIEGMPFGGTVLRLSPNALASANSRIDLIAGNNGSGYLVRDITLDGNRDNQPAFVGNLDNCQMYVINLNGVTPRVINVDVINTFNTGSAECFPIALSCATGTYRNPARAELSRVRVFDHRGYATVLTLLGAGGVPWSPQTGTGNASTDFITCANHGLTDGDSIIVLTRSTGTGVPLRRRLMVRNSTSSTFQVSYEPDSTVLQLDTATYTFYRQAWITGVVRDCVVTSDAPTGEFTTQALGAGGWLNVLIQGNSFFDVYSGLYTDTFHYENVTVVDNFIRLKTDNVWAFASRAISFLSGQGSRNVVIANNTLELYNNSVGIGLNYTATATLTSNVFRYGATGGTQWPIGLVGNNSNVRATDNVFDSGFSYTSATAINSELTWSSGNRLVDGSASGMPESLTTALTSAYQKVASRAWGYENTTSTTVTVANGNRGDVAFDTAGYDAGSLLDTALDRVVCPGTGFIHLTLVVTITVASGSGAMALEWLKNGSATRRVCYVPDAEPGQFRLEINEACVAADVFEARVLNISGADITFTLHKDRTWIEATYTPT